MHLSHHSENSKMAHRCPALATAALACLAAASPSGLVAEQDTKVGYINSAEILANAPGAQEAQEQFDQEMQDSQAELQRMEADLQNRDEELQRQSLTLSPEARTAREQQLQGMQQDYNARFQELQALAERRRAELVQPIMDRVTQVIEELREELGYSLILDSTAGSIIAADPELDLTAEVIARLEALDDEGGGDGEGGAGELRADHERMADDVSERDSTPGS